MMERSDAEKLIRDALAMYRELRTYQDDGFVLVRGKGEEALQRTTFRTHFVRPSSFRFEFSSPHPYPPLAHIVTKCICGLDGSTAYLSIKHHDDAARVQDYEDIVMAVAGATGISHGSAYTIAQLLLDNFDEEPFELLDSAPDGDEVIEGSLCKLVRGKVPRAELDIALTIEPISLTIRKVMTTFPEFTSCEIRRDIRLNEAIAASLFSRP